MSESYFVLSCEHVEDTRVCEDNVGLEPEDGDVFEVSEEGVRIAMRFDWPTDYNGKWGMVRERGALRIRCPKHMPKVKEPDDDSGVSVKTAGDEILLRLSPPRARVLVDSLMGDGGLTTKARVVAALQEALAVYSKPDDLSHATGGVP